MVLDGIQDGFQPDYTLSAYAVMLWVNLDSGRENDGWKNVLIEGTGWDWNFHDYKLRYYIAGSGDQVISSVQFVPGTWYHVAIVVDSSTAKLYINGQLNQQNNSVAATTNRNIKYLFTNSTNKFLKGKVDEIGIFDNPGSGIQSYILSYWNTALSTAVAPASTTLKWLFPIGGESDTDTTILDTSAVGGTSNLSFLTGDFLGATGAPPFCTDDDDTPPPNDKCYAQYFDGGECTQLSSTQNPGSTGSVEYWIKLERSSNNWQDVAVSDGSGGDFYVHYSGKKAHFNYEGEDIIASTSELLLNTWYHQAFTWNTSEVKFYQNGILLQTGSLGVSGGACKAWDSGEFDQMSYAVGEFEDFGKTGTIEYWIKPDVLQSNENTNAIISGFSAVSAGNPDFVQFLVHNNKPALKIDNQESTGGLGDQLIEMDTESMQIGTWYHHAWTWNNNNLKFYKNGNLIKTEQIVSTVPLNAPGGGSSDCAAAYYDGLTTTNIVPALPMANTGLTIEFWVFRQSNDNNRNYIVSSNESVPEFVIRINSGRLDWAGVEDSFISTATIPVSAWTHCALTFDSGTLKMYIAGELDSTHSYPDAINHSLYLIGNINGSSFDGRFIGGLDEFRVWDDVRTLTEIRDNMNSTVSSSSSNLVFYLKFEDTAGVTTLTESTGNSSIILVGHNPGLKHIDAPICTGCRALAFNEVEEFDLGSDITIGATFTIQYWIYIDSDNTNDFLLFNKLSTNDYIQ